MSEAGSIRRNENSDATYFTDEEEKVYDCHKSQKVIESKGAYNRSYPMGLERNQI